MPGWRVCSRRLVRVGACGCWWPASSASCDLAALTGMSESAVSHALRRLRAHRVVLANRRGRMAFYRLDDAPVRMVLDLGLTHPGHITPVATPSPCRHRQIRHTLGSVVLAKGSSTAPSE